MPSLGSVKDRVDALEAKVAANAAKGASDLQDAVNTMDGSQTSTAASGTTRATRRRIDEISQGGASQQSQPQCFNMAAPAAGRQSDQDSKSQHMVKLTGFPHQYTREERVDVAKRIVAEATTDSSIVPTHTYTAYGRLGKEIVFVFEAIADAEKFYKDFTAANAKVYNEVVLNPDAAFAIRVGFGGPGIRRERHISSPRLLVK